MPCQAVREQDFVLIADRTLDVSTEGLLLPLRSRVRVGDALIVSFPIPGLWIDLDATVARVVHGRRPGDDGIAVGVMFDCVPPSTRAALAGFLHGRRAPLPRRGPLARLRRGGDAPRLADEALIRAWDGPEMTGIEIFADESDVLDDEALTEPDPVGILRAVLDAWHDLGVVADGSAS